MEGIPVKISEKYKPPRKITLPGCVINRLNNEPKFDSYEFSLERMVIDQMTQLKELSRKREEKKANKFKSTLDQLEEETKEIKITEPRTNEQQILTPVPITSNSRIEPSRNEGQINLSDFENESSPFDNEELKTLNDLEELAHVLGGSSNSGVKIQQTPKIEQSPNGFSSHYHQQPWNMRQHYVYPSTYAPTYMMNGFSPPNTIPSPLVTSTNVPSSSLNTISDSSRSYPLSPPSRIDSTITHGHLATNAVANNIMVGRYSMNIAQQEPTPERNEHYDETTKILKNIQNRLNERQIAHQQQEQLKNLDPTQVPNVSKAQIPSNMPNSSNSESIAHNPYGQLNAQEGAIAKRMSEMGFPLPRAARAVQRFGTDEAKVIEFLLQVQSIVDQDFPELRVERALEINHFQEEETIQYLNSMKQIMKLGFQEEEVITALARSENDRDKALDFLIS